MEHPGWPLFSPRLPLGTPQGILWAVCLSASYLAANPLFKTWGPWEGPLSTVQGPQAAASYQTSIQPDWQETACASVAPQALDLLMWVQSRLDFTSEALLPGERVSQYGERCLQIAKGVLESPLGQHLAHSMKPAPIFASIELEAVAATWRALTLRGMQRLRSGAASVVSREYGRYGAGDTNACTGEGPPAADTAADVLSPVLRKIVWSQLAADVWRLEDKAGGSGRGHCTGKAALHHPRATSASSTAGQGKLVPILLAQTITSAARIWGLHQAIGALRKERGPGAASGDMPCPIDVDEAGIPRTAVQGAPSSAAQPRNTMAWEVAADVAEVASCILDAAVLQIGSAAPGLEREDEGVHQDMEQAKGVRLHGGFEGGSCFECPQSEGFWVAEEERIAASLPSMWEAVRAAVLGSPVLVDGRGGLGQLRHRSMWLATSGLLAQLLSEQGERLGSVRASQRATRAPSWLLGDDSRQTHAGEGRTHVAADQAKQELSELGLIGSQLAFAMIVLVVFLRTVVLKRAWSPGNRVGQLVRRLCTDADALLPGWRR
eukprot:jgi/Botrbrau1/17249/Bobra.0015s0008.1